jgi:ribosomal protein L21E
MAHQFTEGQRVTVLEDGQLGAGVNQYRGRTGTVDHIVESAPDVIFYNVAFGGSWDRATSPRRLGSCI